MAVEPSAFNEMRVHSGAWHTESSYWVMAGPGAVPAVGYWKLCCYYKMKHM